MLGSFSVVFEVFVGFGWTGTTGNLALLTRKHFQFGYLQWMFTQPIPNHGKAFTQNHCVCVCVKSGKWLWRGMPHLKSKKNNPRNKQIIRWRVPQHPVQTNILLTNNANPVELPKRSTFKVFSCRHFHFHNIILNDNKTYWATPA